MVVAIWGKVDIFSSSAFRQLSYEIVSRVAGHEEARRAPDLYLEVHADLGSRSTATPAEYVRQRFAGNWQLGRDRIGGVRFWFFSIEASIGPD